MYKLLFTLAVVLLAGFVRAQETNIPPSYYSTAIENFEAQTNTILVKGFVALGSIPVNAGKITVRCKETVDITHGRKMYGIIVDFGAPGAPITARRFAVVDEDELGALLAGFEYLAKISSSASNMPSFDAETTTKSGLCIEAHSSQRQGAIFYYVLFGDVEVAMTMDEMSQLQNLINQARTDITNLEQGR